MNTDSKFIRQIVQHEKRPPEIIPLNLIFDYPVQWSRYKVLRDLLQNFYDAVGYESWLERFSFVQDGDTLFFIGSDVGFSYDWLIPIGASTKRDAPGKYAGYFGEGFKIASLCALRDYGWKIELASQNWKLRVVVKDLMIDGIKVPSLAYHLWKRSQPHPDTVLALSPFSRQDSEVLESAVLSFYDPQNPLFGSKIWSNSSAAVFHRSSMAKPANYPSTYGCRGTGIIYAGYQALGAFPFPLIVAQHDCHRHDRERNDFYDMDVFKVLEHVCGLVSPECAIALLEIFQSKWYSYPQKRYDFKSWYPVVRRLVQRVSCSPEETRRWREKHPNLLVAERVKPCHVPEYNRRRQALAWFRQECSGHRLVQDGFLNLGYPRLETACEKADGFSHTREPRNIELGLIRTLEELSRSILGDFFGDEPPPPCRVIDAAYASWEGMTVTLRLNQPRKTRHGFVLRYQLPWVALKKRLLRKDGFQEAFSTYLHERAHCFGGDQSASFSLALTHILETTLRHGTEISKAKAIWDDLHENA